MKRNFLLLLIINCGLLAQAAVNDTFNHNGIRYQITKEDFSLQAFEVSAVYFDSAYIFLPDSVSEGEYAYAVTNTIQWYNPQNCALRHYSKIDMSRAEHITNIFSQISALIAIDTLILPPNLLLFPGNFYTSDTISWRNNLMDTDSLLPGIHRIWSTGTQALENLSLSQCTSLIEADLSTYTSTFSEPSKAIGAFYGNPFLERLVLPNTITTFSEEIFGDNIRLTDLNIPDSLTGIYGDIAHNLLKDTLCLGKKVEYIFCSFAGGWYNLRHIEVDSGNPYFMDDNGVLFTKDQLTLLIYPNLRDGSEYHIPTNTEILCRGAFCHGWTLGEASDFGDGVFDASYVWFLKSKSDAIPLKVLECNPMLRELGDGTFWGTGIRNINRFAENYVMVIPTHCFMLAAIDSITLPWRVTDIHREAFAFAYNLQSITNLSKLKNLRFIGEGAFRDAWKLDSVDLLPCDKLLDIPKSMCLNDSALKFVSLPRNVQTIGDEAFKNCVSLQQFVCPAIEPIEIDKSVFEGVDKQACVLKVPARSINLYRNAPVWKEFFHIDTTGFYYIEATSSDTLAGTVTGSGTYFTGESAILEAKANSGYRFATWSDGYPYNPRLVEVTKDESYTAIFEESPFYTLTVLSNDSTMGTVTGSGYYEEGAKVAVTAVPNDGYYLHSWDFTDEVSTDIIFTMPSSDITLTAYFAPKEESVETIENTAMPHKFLKEGTFYILRNNKTYTLQGQEVK